MDPKSDYYHSPEETPETITYIVMCREIVHGVQIDGEVVFPDVFYDLHRYLIAYKRFINYLDEELAQKISEVEGFSSDQVAKILDFFEKGKEVFPKTHNEEMTLIEEISAFIEKEYSDYRSG